jgi:ankyrin repeat protein
VDRLCFGAACRNKEGWTPLHTAAASGRQGIVEKLVAAGADSQAEDFKGRAPQDVAGNQECYAMLRLSSVYVQDADRLRAQTLRAESLGRTLGVTGASLLSSSYADSDDDEHA